MEYYVYSRKTSTVIADRVIYILLDLGVTFNTLPALYTLNVTLTFINNPNKAFVNLGHNLSYIITRAIFLDLKNIEN